MAYEQQKDITIKKWFYPVDDTSRLECSIQDYENMPRKFCIGPRSWLNHDSVRKFGRVGRLTRDEALWLADCIAEGVENFMDNEKEVVPAYE